MELKVICKNKDDKSGDQIKDKSTPPPVGMAYQDVEVKNEGATKENDLPVYQNVKKKDENDYYSLKPTTPAVAYYETVKLK